MNTQRQRIQTIIALVNSHDAYGGSVLNKLKREFHQVTAVDTISPPNRRNLLKVLHATRALDTSLKTLLSHHHVLGSATTIGQYLVRFRDHTSASIGTIAGSERSRYQRSIATIRNRHLHDADSYPQNESAVNQLISEMQALVSRVVNL